MSSLLSFVLQVTEESLGALNLYSKEKDAFTDEDVATGSLFAAQAAVQLANAQTHARDENKIDQLQQGLVTRSVIGQAVGIIMATRHVDSEKAFEVLRKISQTTNVKLRELAVTLVQKANETH